MDNSNVTSCITANCIGGITIAGVIIVTSILLAQWV